MKCITITGNLGADAVRRVASDGKELMTFNVAVNAGKDQTIWFNCIGNMREKLLPFLIKGQTVCVIGDLSPAIYNGKLDLQINVDKCELCGSKREDNSQQPAQEAAPQPEPNERKVEVY